MKLVTTKICKTSDIGVNDNLFGGTMLAWLDEAGAIYSSKRVGDQNMVTVKMDEVIFKKPVKVKDCINIYAKTKHIGQTSIQIVLQAKRHIFIAVSEDAPVIPEEIVCSTVMVFVRIDENGKPRNILN